MLYIYCDGASRGNPGEASIGVAAFRDSAQKETVFEISERLGIATNNFAEWTSLISAVEKALSIGEKDLQIFMDSELVVKQVQGLYKVKHPSLQELKVKFDSVKKGVASFKIAHVPREKNKAADALANKAFTVK